jgi:hypothetical protein
LAAVRVAGVDGAAAADGYLATVVSADSGSALATLADVAGMGSLKRLMYDTKAMTEEAHQLLAAAKLERVQVGNAVELSPEVQAARKAIEEGTLDMWRQRADADGATP